MSGILSMVLLFLLIVLGIIYCFWGYRYLKIIIMIFALLGGGAFVYSFLSATAPELGNGVWVIAIAAGLALGLLAFFFIKFCIFLAGGIVGIAIFNILRDLSPAYFAGLDTAYVFLIGLACFVVMGIVTLAAKRHLIIVVTAVFGAYTLTYMAGILFGLLGDPSALRGTEVATAITTLAPLSVFRGAPAWAMLIPVAVLSVAGMAVQYRHTARGKA